MDVDQHRTSVGARSFDFEPGDTSYAVTTLLLRGNPPQALAHDANDQVSTVGKVLAFHDGKPRTRPKRFHADRQELHPFQSFCDERATLHQIMDRRAEKHTPDGFRHHWWSLVGRSCTIGR